MARVPPSAAEALLRQGGVSPAPGPAQAASPRWLSCYLTFDAIMERLGEIAASRPEVASLVDVGPTWEAAYADAPEDRRLWALRLTGGSGLGNKPRFLLLALHHAREVVTPVTAMAFVDELVSSYGEDPALTWLLDTSEVWVLPAVNPDGYLRAQQKLDWRKNANGNACPDMRPHDGAGPGVDLNRNYAYGWGGPGASSEPCNELYRGEGPFSEPETRALRDLMTDVGFDLVISLHSYSALVLYPWGYTEATAPDQDGLSGLASLLANYSGYQAGATHELYLSSGDTCDWVYGELGAPCLTIEIGSMREGYFWPQCGFLDCQVAENLDGLVHAARLAPDPYGLSGGPLAGPVVVACSDGRAEVSSIIDDARSGGQAIAAAEWWLDEAEAAGSGERMSIARLSAGRVSARAELALDGVPAGRRWILVRARDTDGNWGPITAGWLEGGTGATPAPSAPPAATATPSSTSTVAPTETSTPTTMATTPITATAAPSAASPRRRLLLPWVLRRHALGAE